jgi:signal peptidase I
MEDREQAVRKVARWRSAILPGAGFALLGYPLAAGVSFGLTAIFVAATVVVSFAPGELAAWLALASLIGAVVLWIAESVAVNLVPIRPSDERSVSARHFGAVCALAYIGVIAASASILVNFGVLYETGQGMVPVVYPDERIVYHKRVESADLARGALVAFRVSPQSSSGRGGEVVIARIIAVPGNAIAIRAGHYWVDGADTGVEVAAVGRFGVVVEVSEAPKQIVVPPDCFFIVQEQPSQGLDSRILSWTRREDVVGTKFWLVSRRGLGLAIR